MNRVVAAVAVIAVLSFAASEAYRVSADEKLSLESIMEKHKGKEAPVQTIIAGKADEKLLKEYLAYYEFMATQKPPVGDTAAFKKKCDTLVEATKGLIAKKPEALEAFKNAINCKACHTDHKPKKEK
ncbi:MAG TPA: hypothetical protein VEK08_25670 [Planctomycetota bacterium]|nr:hypothetical protein [Planctomycetota bacterium]